MARLYIATLGFNKDNAAPADAHVRGGAAIVCSSVCSAEVSTPAVTSAPIIWARLGRLRSLTSAELLAWAAGNARIVKIEAAANRALPDPTDPAYAQVLLLPCWQSFLPVSGPY